MTYEVIETKTEFLRDVTRPEFMHDASRPFAVIMVLASGRKACVSRHSTRKLAMAAALRQRNKTQVR